jgi:predicted component of type VI protein secretion system
MTSSLPATLEQRVKERVQDTIASLLPDDELARLVEAQVAHFRAHSLNEMIRKNIAEMFDAAIKEALKGPEFCETWNPQVGQSAASKVVRQVITESAGDILTAMIGQHAQMVVNRMRGGY